MTRCHCGRSLHYPDPRVRDTIERLNALTGSEFLPITVGDRTWLVQRHYIALHNLNEADLVNGKLGFEEIPYQPDERDEEMARLIDTLRAAVAAGDTHECAEWWTAEGLCALCDRRRPPVRAEDRSLVTLTALEQFVNRGRAAQAAVDRILREMTGSGGRHRDS